MRNSKIRTNSDWKEAAFPYATILLAFFIPILRYGIQIPLFLFILSWIFYPKASFKKNFWPFIIFSGIYLFHLIGMFYTEHIDEGLTDLMSKLSLLLFPFIFALAKPMGRRMRRLVVIAFAIGTVLSVIIDFIVAGVNYEMTGDIHSFYMSNFSAFFHPSYVAMYINFSIAIFLTCLTALDISKGEKVVLWVGILLLSITLVFPASKMGMLVFLFLVLFFLIKWITNRNFRHPNTALLIFVAIVAMLFFRFDPIASNRINSALKYAEGDEHPTKSEQVESNAARIYAWTTALESIRDYPLGVGTGDGNIELWKRFREKGLDELADKDLNPHNEYLQLGMALGIPAVLWFLFSLIFPFRKIIRTKDWLYAFFLLSFAANILVESMLEKQSGVIYFAFLNSFFFFNALKTEKKT